MERNTPYSAALGQIISTSPSFKKIYDYNIQNYPRQRFTAPQIFSALASGTSIIQGSDLLMCYMATYAGHHYHKLMSSIPTLVREIPSNSNISIIDYGCGQGLATFILLDYLISSAKNLKITQITLIEPSSDALDRGAFHVGYFLKALNHGTDIIRTVNKRLDDIEQSDLSANDSDIKIHLFSNILDVDAFSLEDLHEKIYYSQNNSNFFLCVSPFNPTRQRLLTFYELFAEHDRTPHFVEQGPLHKRVFNIQTLAFQDDYQITMFQRLFHCRL